MRADDAEPAAMWAGKAQRVAAPLELMGRNGGRAHATGRPLVTQRAQLSAAFQGFWIVTVSVAALTAVTMYMWSPTRLPLEFAGVDINNSSPALKLEAMFVRIEPRALADSCGLRLVAVSDWSVMRVSAEPFPLYPSRVRIWSDW